MKAGFSSRLTLLDLPTRVYGRWAILRLAKPKDGKARAACLCECGTERICDLYSVVAGKSQSCGCLKKERTRAALRTHGLTRTLLYRVCHQMKSRCQYPKHERFQDYGGRGVEFRFTGAGEAAQWILANIGPRPSPRHSLDRKDNNGHYEPGNLRWATAKEQRSNCRPRRRTLEQFTTAELVRELESRKIAA